MVVESKPFKKQMLQEDAWHNIQRTQSKRICMTTGAYPRRTSGTFSASRQASQVIKAWPCLSSRCQNQNISLLQGTVESHCRERPRIFWMDNTNEWTGQSLSLLVAAHRRRQKSMGNPYSRYVYRRIQTTPGRHGSY